MNRRSFLSRLGIGTAAVAATTVVPSAPAKETKLEDGSLRPKCPQCRERMLVRYDGTAHYAFCGMKNCKKYGIMLNLRPTGD
jgi:transposase-like protein